MPKVYRLADHYGARRASGAPDPAVPFAPGPRRCGDSHILFDPFDPRVLNDLGRATSP
jgi:hypothetical protein